MRRSPASDRREGDAGESYRPNVYVAEITAADLAVRIGVLEQTVAELVRQLGASLEITKRVLARVSDPTHVTINEAAQILGVNAKTIRRRIASGAYTLEGIPGTGKRGIPVEQITKGWVNAAILKKAKESD